MKTMMIFEVMDKEPSLFVIWGCAASIALLGFILCRFNYKFIIIVLTVVVILSLTILFEINDPDVGAAIIKEAGRSYVIQTYIAILSAITFPLIGAIYNYRRRLNSSSMS